MSPTHLFVSGLVSQPMSDLAEYEVVERRVDDQVDGDQEHCQAAEDRETSREEGEAATSETQAASS